jgi:hypothetical protein
MGSPDGTPRPDAATARARFLRRAREARAFVASVDPSLLDTSGVDTTLHDLTLSFSVIERLEFGYRHELSNEWLRGLRRADSSTRR